MWRSVPHYINIAVFAHVKLSILAPLTYIPIFAHILMGVVSWRKLAQEVSTCRSAYFRVEQEKWIERTFMSLACFCYLCVLVHSYRTSYIRGVEQTSKNVGKNHLQTDKAVRNRAHSLSMLSLFICINIATVETLCSFCFTKWSNVDRGYATNDDNT